MNAYFESFHSILERHLFGIRDFMTYEKAYEALEEYMDFYNNLKIHGGLIQMSPAQFSEWTKTLEDTSAFHRKV